jgi:hypothetical protein
MFTLANTPKINQQVFVGGYPATRTGAEFSFINRRIEEFNGYNGKENTWNDLSKIEQRKNIGHFIDDDNKLFSVGNEMSLCANSRSLLAGGASGSMAFVYDSTNSTSPFQLLGIYWGN